MPAILRVHKVTYTIDSVTKTIFFRSRPETYVGLGTESGVDIASADEAAGQIIADVEDLLASGELVRVKLGYTIGTKTKYAQLILPVTRMLTFRKAMLGKTYRGGNVVSIRGRRVASFS